MKIRPDKGEITIYRVKIVMGKTYDYEPDSERQLFLDRTKNDTYKIMRGGKILHKADQLQEVNAFLKGYLSSLQCYNKKRLGE